MPTFSVPDHIAEAVVLPASHRDEERVQAAHAWLRENMPLGRATVPGWDPVWLVSKNADIVEVERAVSTFPIGDFNQILRNQASDDFQRNILGNGRIRVMHSLSAMDAPEHTQVRSIAQQWFMPARVRQLEEQVRSDAKDAVDGLASGDPEIDFVKEFALLYPLRVIMTLIGVPREDEPYMLGLTQEFFGTREPAPAAEGAAPDPAEVARQWHAAVTQFLDYFSALIEQKRKVPGEDFATLIANTIDDGSLDPVYGATFCLSMAAAGHDTTSSTVSGAFLALIQNPDELAKCVSDPSLIPGLVEESMRWVTPVKHFMRSCAEPAEVRGVPIERGDRLMLLYSSANRDEEVFDRPFSFEVERKPNRHLALGTGPHACLGMHVARLEMRVLWEELLPRLQSLELTGEPAYIATNWVGGLKSLPVRIGVSP